jgi:hypothetical protein
MTFADTQAPRREQIMRINFAMMKLQKSGNNCKKRAQSRRRYDPKLATRG